MRLLPGALDSIRPGRHLPAEAFLCLVALGLFPDRPGGRLAGGVSVDNHVLADGADGKVTEETSE